MRDLFSLKGRVFVVTGASGALAGSLARYLVEQGASVAFVSRSADKLALPPGGLAFACDVLDRHSMERVREELLKKFGRIDGLVNAAGGNRPGATVMPDKSVFDLSLDDYDSVLDLNLKGTVIPSLAFGKAFSEAKRGAIVNFSSMAAGPALTRVLGYGNAKAAVENLTRWLAVELAQKYGEGLRVNAVAPGFFIGEQNRKLLLNEDGTPTERGAKVLARTPFRRFGKAEEIHGAVHYLLSDAAAFVTGTVLAVDGGFSAHSGV